MQSSSLSSSSTSPPSSSLSYLRPEVRALQRTLLAFVENECIPAEAEYDLHLRHRSGRDRFSLDAVPPCLDRLKSRAKRLGLWNLFVPPHLVEEIPDKSLAPRVALTHREYGILCETLGRCPSIAPEACNASAPDTGNMEVLLQFGTREQKQRYLLPLLRGESRSAFLMTEPDVASSDPTNLQTRLVVKNRGASWKYELTGRKWWSTGAMDPRCRLALVVAKMDYSQVSQVPQNGEDGNQRKRHGSSSPSSRHGAHTIVAVPLPNPAVTVVRPLTVFGYDDAPSGHAEVALNGVQLDECDLILGEGSGFVVSQARLGPGRIHHCMRAIGMGTHCSPA